MRGASLGPTEVVGTPKLAHKHIRHHAYMAPHIWCHVYTAPCVYGATYTAPCVYGAMHIWRHVYMVPHIRCRAYMTLGEQRGVNEPPGESFTA